jgi:serine/threonine protein kinase
MGEVYRATDTKLGRDVALKVLPLDVASDPERLERFRREARALAAINHPHIVTIFSVEEADGIHFLTMELVEGQSLDHSIPKGGLPLDRLAKIAIALADALAAAHEKGIVHRDLKPANVMITNEGQVKVLDFGLAKEMRATSPNDATLTSAGHTGGGRGDGDAGLHVARTNRGPHRRPPHGYFLAGHPVVRDGDRAAALPGAFLGRAGLRDPAGHATGDHGHTE